MGGGSVVRDHHLLAPLAVSARTVLIDAHPVSGDLYVPLALPHLRSPNRPFRASPPACVAQGHLPEHLLAELRLLILQILGVGDAEP